MLKSTRMQSDRPSLVKGFTIIELLIVIVIIGILAGISVVVYNHISKQAKDASMASTARLVERKVHATRAIEGQASPPSSTGIENIRSHYELGSLGDTVIVMSFDINGDCVASRSDTCDWNDPIFDNGDYILMGIFPTGSTGGGMSGCNSYGGVDLRYYSGGAMIGRLTIPDGTSDRVGHSCWALS